MMINTELASLAIAIEYPDLSHIVFENMGEDSWVFGDSKIIFEKIKQLYENGQAITWPMMFDILRAEVHKSTVDSMISLLAGIPESQAEKVLREYLEKLKINRARSKALQEIQKQAQGAVFNLDEIKKIIDEAEMKSVSIEDAMLRVAYDEYLAWITAEHSGIMTGFPSFDHLTDSLNFGELATIIGRTKVGKSWCGINIAINIAREHSSLPLAFFSMEMPKAAIAERLMQIEYNKSRWELKPDVRLDPDGFRAVFTGRFPNISIYGGIYGPDEIKAMIRKYGYKVVFLDFLGLIRPLDSSGSLYQQTSQKMIHLKQIAKETRALIILLVQLSRAAGYGNLPVSIDMCRDAGTVEELSDFIYGIWSPGLDPNLSPAEENKWRNRIAFALLKNKRGPGKTIICHFDTRTGRIIEEAEDGNMG